MRTTLLAVAFVLSAFAASAEEHPFRMYSEDWHKGRNFNDGLKYYADNNSDSSICLEPYLAESFNIQGEWVDDVIVLEPRAKHVFLGAFSRTTLNEYASIEVGVNYAVDCQ